jgi:3-deoxy-D-manno-octulosonate 8-phosphate phosphatase (KDO 8-P phosphatase)
MQANNNRLTGGIAELETRASAVSLLLLDVDGVLTDGRLYFSNSGEEMKTFHTLDGQGIRFALEAGIGVGIITGRESALVSQRCKDLGINIVYQGVGDKSLVLDQICAEKKLAAASIAYVGDDAPDVPVLMRVGLAASVPAGHRCALDAAHLISDAQGGSGAVREIIDFILASQNKLTY